MDSPLALVLYFVFVAVSVAGVYVLLKGLGQGATIAVDRAEALRLLAEYEPGAEVFDVLELERMAVLKLSEGRIGFARGMGHRPTLHVIDGASIKKIRATASDARIDLKDYAVPSIPITLQDRDRLEAFLAGGAE